MPATCGPITCIAPICLLLDMEDARSLAVHDANAALIDTRLCFDAGKQRVSKISLCPYSEIHCGVRERISARCERSVYRAFMREEGMVNYARQVGVRRNSEQLVGRPAPPEPALHAA